MREGEEKELIHWNENLDHMGELNFFTLDTHRFIKAFHESAWYIYT